MSKAMTRKAWLEYLQKAVDEFDWEAAGQEQGEPVACERCKQLQDEDYRAMYLKVRDELAELQQRTWVGLTKEDIDYLGIHTTDTHPEDFIRYVEAKLKEKNT